MTKEIRTKYFYVPITKSVDTDDGEACFVQGFFTSDQKDEIGDIITRSATELALPKYRQWGNVRYMHQPRPVGRVERIGLTDGLEWNEVEIKVIDPQAVFEVRSGLLTALSVGIFFGWDDFEIMEDGGWMINNYVLGEISLVDHPANYDALLTDVRGRLLSLARYHGTDAVLRDMDAIKDVLSTESCSKCSSDDNDATAIDETVEPTEELHDNVELTEKGVIPYSDTGTADKGESWSKPGLGDFTDQEMEELSASERRRIARHYTWSDNMPPETFADLKLPHHRAAASGVGPAVWRGVANAMARLNQTQGVDQDGCYSHLANHYAQFDEEPPEKSLVLSGEYIISDDVQKSPACRQEGESEQDCVSRKIPEIKEEHPDWDDERVQAAAYSMCEEACSEDALASIDDSDFDDPDAYTGPADKIVEREEVEEDDELSTEAIAGPTEELSVDEVINEVVEPTEELPTDEVVEEVVEPVEELSLDAETDEADDEVAEYVATDNADDADVTIVSSVPDMTPETVDVLEPLRDELNTIRELLEAVVKALQLEERPSGEDTHEELDDVKQANAELEAENKSLRDELEALKLPKNRVGAITETVLPEEVEDEEHEEPRDISPELKLRLAVRKRLETNRSS